MLVLRKYKAQNEYRCVTSLLDEDERPFLGPPPLPSGRATQSCRGAREALVLGVRIRAWAASTLLRRSPVGFVLLLRCGLKNN